jgi:hypothetical protein
MSGGESQSGDASPRSFVTATGYVFQIVGFVLVMGGCVLWGFAGFVEDRLDEPINTASDYFKSDALAATVSLACILTTVVAGLGLLGTGLGLQGENRSSGQWALVVTGVLAAVWWGGAVTFWIISAPIWKIIVAAFSAGAGSVLFLLAGNSARILKLHPPPDDLNVVTDEFLDKYSHRHSE